MSASDSNWPFGVHDLNVSEPLETSRRLAC